MRAGQSRIRRRADFLAAARGRRIEADAFLMQGRDRRDDGDPRFGLTVTKRTGSAVERNRIRRRLRAAVDSVLGQAGRPGFDYVLIARRTALTASFASIVRELERGLARLHRQPGKRDGGSAHG